MRLLGLLAVVMSILSAVPAMGQASCSWQIVGQGQPFRPSNGATDMVELGGDVYVAEPQYGSPAAGTVHRWNANAGWTLIGNPTTSGVHSFAVSTESGQGQFPSISGASRRSRGVTR